MIVSAGIVTRMRTKRNTYRVSVGKPQQKKPMGRPRHRWNNKITMDFSNIRRNGMNMISQVQDRDRWGALVYMVMNIQFPYCRQSASI
jgi:hypothetical protein